MEAGCTFMYCNCVKYHELTDQELNELCCTRLGWEKKSHVWEHGSTWHQHAWFKGETLLGFPNFLSQDPVVSQLQEFIEACGLQNEYGYCLFELLEARKLQHDHAWYVLAHASPRHRVLAFLRATEKQEQLEGTVLDGLSGQQPGVGK